MHLERRDRIAVWTLLIVVLLIEVLLVWMPGVWLARAEGLWLVAWVAGAIGLGATICYLADGVVAEVSDQLSLGLVKGGMAPIWGIVFLGLAIKGSVEPVTADQ